MKQIVLPSSVPTRESPVWFEGTVSVCVSSRRPLQQHRLEATQWASASWRYGWQLSRLRSEEGAMDHMAPLYTVLCALSLRWKPHNCKIRKSRNWTSVAQIIPDLSTDFSFKQSTTQTLCGRRHRATGFLNEAVQVRQHARERFRKTSTFFKTTPKSITAITRNQTHRQ